MIAAFIVPQEKPKKKYIDLDVAINAVYEAYANGESAYDALESIPPADVVPVVLCRDCKQYGGRPWENNETGICARTDSGVGEDDFCSYGEKREEG